MEVIDTIVRNGKSDMVLILFLCLAFLLGCIIAVKASYPLMLFVSSVNLIAFGVFFIVIAFLPEQTEYKAVVTDYQTVQDNGYMILEHLEGDTYLIDEVKNELKEK